MANVHDSIGMEMIVLLVLITRTKFISSSYSITMTMECKYVIANGLKRPLECNYSTLALPQPRIMFWVPSSSLGYYLYIYIYYICICMYLLYYGTSVYMDYIRARPEDA